MGLRPHLLTTGYLKTFFSLVAAGDQCGFCKSFKKMFTLSQYTVDYVLCHHLLDMPVCSIEIFSCPFFPSQFLLQNPTCFGKRSIKEKNYI
jgi:hypothetical protein